jgi:peptidoglycan/LPS O-acetylase OafA/YrhL
MYEAKRSTGAPPPVDETDWLKTVAIIFVSAGHFGFFFVNDDRWWSVFGRFAAPPFFFLVGYAQSRTVPLYWIWIGIILTLLESWNAEWTWVAPNILLSFVLIRIARPYVQQGLEEYGWAAFALLVCGFVAAQPIAARLVDYGAEGWLWAFFGLCQRRFADNKSPATGSIEAQDPPLPAHATNVNWGLMRLAACIAAAVVFVGQEQKEYLFPPLHLAVFIVGLSILCVSLWVFERGPSRIQPAEPIAGALRFIGRRTFEIYAIQLAGSELLVKLVPDLAP